MQTRLGSASSYLNSARIARQVFQRQGGLAEMPPHLQTVILPDLHGQRDYLLQVLAMAAPGKPKTSVFQELQKGKINVLCLGDGMHCEHRAARRWLQAERDYLEGKPSQAIEDELVESMGLLKMVMDLKSEYPNNFFFARGNHEDMDPKRPYRKFTEVGESLLVKQAVVERFGRDFLKQWHDCEGSMPLVVRGGSFVASHAAPEEPLTIPQVQGRADSAFRACCWSDNTKWRPGSPQERAFEANCKIFKASATRPWVVGHRKVEGARFRSQCGGKLLQINPLDYQPRIVIIAPPSGKALVPDRDVQLLSAKKVAAAGD